MRSGGEGYFIYSRLVTRDKGSIPANGVYLGRLKERKRNPSSPLGEE